MLIAEEFLLLCYDDATGKSALGVPIDPALGAAVLVELALRERIGVRPDDRDRLRLRVVDSAPTDDPVLDDALGYLADRDEVKVYDVVNGLASSPITRGLRDRLLARLLDAGVLGRERDKVLGVFPRTTWPTTDAGPEAGVRQRLHLALLEGETPTEQTAALIGLLRATGHLSYVVDTDDRKALKARAAEIAEGDWAAAAVKAAVDEFVLVVLLL